jgi:hypothetical protein
MFVGSDLRASAPQGRFPCAGSQRATFGGFPREGPAASGPRIHPFLAPLTIVAARWTDATVGGAVGVGAILLLVGAPPAGCLISSLRRLRGEVGAPIAGEGRDPSEDSGGGS